MDRFTYFMIRVRHPEPGDAASALSGVIERLGHGEKKPFDTSEQLLQLIGDWAAHPLELQPHRVGPEESVAP